MGRRLPILDWDDRPQREIRSRRHKISAPRVTREGNRPEVLGPMTAEERRDALLDAWDVLVRMGLKFGPPKDDRDCAPGPCAHVSCRHHLAVDVELTRVRLNFPGRDVDQIPESCSLRVARKAAERREDDEDIFAAPVMTCDEVGVYMNLAAEPVRELANRALAKFRMRMRALMGIPAHDKTGARRRQGAP